MNHPCEGKRRGRSVVVPLSRLRFPAGVCRAFLCILWLLAVSIGWARAEDSGPSEYQVKAAFLYNFTKYVEWPPDAFASNDSPFVIGVVGKDPFGRALTKALDGKTMDGREFVIRNFKQPDDITTCHLLFVSESEKGRLGRILEQANKTATLTVGDSDQFLQKGGMINFVIQNQKVRFEINPNAADRAGLKISSRLLALAKVVRS